MSVAPDGAGYSIQSSLSLCRRRLLLLSVAQPSPTLVVFHITYRHPLPQTQGRKASGKKMKQKKKERKNREIGRRRYFIMAAPDQKTWLIAGSIPSFAPALPCPALAHNIIPSHVLYCTVHTTAAKESLWCRIGPCCHFRQWHRTRII